MVASLGYLAWWNGYDTAVAEMASRSSKLREPSSGRDGSATGDIRSDVPTGPTLASLKTTSDSRKNSNPASTSSNSSKTSEPFLAADPVNKNELWCKIVPATKPFGDQEQCEYAQSCYHCRSLGAKISAPTEPGQQLPTCSDQSQPLPQNISCCPSKGAAGEISCPSIQDCLNDERDECDNV